GGSMVVFVYSLPFQSIYGLGGYQVDRCHPPTVRHANNPLGRALLLRTAFPRWHSVQHFTIHRAIYFPEIGYQRHRLRLQGQAKAPKLTVAPLCSSPSESSPNQDLPATRFSWPSFPRPPRSADIDSSNPLPPTTRDN